MASTNVRGNGRSVGRGPAGNVRNMGAMTDAKLLAVETILRTEPGQQDPEALRVAQYKLRERGYAWADNEQRWTTRQRGVLVMPVFTDEISELLAWLAEEV